MPQGKNIYRFISSKILNKNKDSGGPSVPPSVDNFRKNKPRFARSLNTSPSLQKVRKISPNEGRVAVNGSAGDEIQKKAVRSVKPKIIEIEASAGVIKPARKKRIARKRRTKKSNKDNAE